MLENSNDELPDLDDIPVSAGISIADEGGTFTEHDIEAADALQNPATGRAIATATAGIGVLHGARLLVGMIAQPLIANRLGIQWQADVYAVSSELVRSIWTVFEKVINPTLLPNFIHALADEGEERAWGLASTAMWLMMLALLVVTPIVFLTMPFIVDIYSPGAQGPERALTIELSRVLLAGLFFLSISSLTYVILNGYKRFASAALGDTLWKVGIAGAAAIAVGTKMGFRATLYILTWGFVIGSFFKLLPHLIALRSKWKHLQFKIDWHDPLVKKMLWLAVPLLLGIVVSESRGVFLFRLADSSGIDVPGSRAALKFSKLIGDNLIQIFPYALSIGIFPYLADMARSRDRQPFTDTLMSALRVCIFVFGPLMAILIAVRYDLLSAVWQSGKFTQEDVFVLSLPFVAYSLGLIAFACESILNQTFYAMTNAWTPTIIGLITTVVWVVMAWAGVEYGAAAGLGLAGIAIAESFAKSLKCVLLWALLRRHLGDTHVKENLLFCLKVLIGSLIAALIAWLVTHNLAPTEEIASVKDKIRILLAVMAGGLSGVLVYVALGYYSGMREVRQLIEFTGKVRRRFARG